MNALPTHRRTDAPGDAGADAGRQPRPVAVLLARLAANVAGATVLTGQPFPERWSGPGAPPDRAGTTAGPARHRPTPKSPGHAVVTLPGGRPAGHVRRRRLRHLAVPRTGGAARFLPRDPPAQASYVSGRACQRAGRHRGVARRPASQPRHSQAPGPGGGARPVGRAPRLRRRPRRPALGRLAARRRGRHPPGLRLRAASRARTGPRPARTRHGAGHRRARLRPAPARRRPRRRPLRPHRQRRAPQARPTAAPCGRRPTLSADELAATAQRARRGARALARGPVRRARGRRCRRRRAGPARGAAQRRPRGPGGGRAGPRGPRDRRGRARGAHRGVPAPRAAVGPARRRAGPGRPAGGRAGRAAPGPRRPRCRARPRAQRRAARRPDRGAPAGPGASAWSSPARHHHHGRPARSPPPAGAGPPAAQPRAARSGSSRLSRRGRWSVGTTS